MKALCSVIVAIFLLLTPCISNAGVFGEVALSAGGNFPQGSFTRYADPGFMLFGRGTLHIPNVEMFVVWADFGFAHFKSETVETKRILYEIIDGPTVYRAVDQTTSEN
ncbi:MAG: hypothetical protein GY841_07105, partial [FCB group bacterium]|nr:hypothetical protein [FCB group bacterium]